VFVSDYRVRFKLIKSRNDRNRAAFYYYNYPNYTREKTRDTSVLAQRSYRPSYYFIRRLVVVKKRAINDERHTSLGFKNKEDIWLSRWKRKIVDHLRASIKTPIARRSGWKEIERHNIDFTFNLIRGLAARDSSHASTRCAIPIKPAFCVCIRGHKGPFLVGRGVARDPPRWPGSNLHAAITRAIRIMSRYLKYPAIYAFTRIIPPRLYGW